MSFDGLLVSWTLENWETCSQNWLASVLAYTQPEQSG